MSVKHRGKIEVNIPMRQIRTSVREKWNQTTKKKVTKKRK